VLAGGDQLSRAGLRALLAVSGIPVVAEAPTWGAAIGLVRRLCPDVVILDTPLASGEVQEALRLLAPPAAVDPVPVLVVADGDGRSDEDVQAVLRAGVAGLLAREETGPEDLSRAVRACALGAATLSPSLTRGLLDWIACRAEPSGPRHPRLAALTAREHEVLLLVAAGLSNAEIAARLFVTEATVKAHVNRLLAKLHLRDRVQVVVLAYREGIVGTRAS
jgi:DNA-binding NarL/FixJ family response regulator